MTDTQQQIKIETADCVGIAVGSNATDDISATLKIVEQAVEKVHSMNFTALSSSALYQTEAFPPGSGPNFVNAALCGVYANSPEQLLADLHEIEDSMGRTRNQRWEQRVIDLDLIFYDQVVLPDHETHTTWRDMELGEQMKVTPRHLILPHPRMQDRSFVLTPFMDVAPDWTHPILGKTIRQMHADRPAEERESVVLLKAG